MSQFYCYCVTCLVKISTKSEKELFKKTGRCFRCFKRCKIGPGAHLIDEDGVYIWNSQQKNRKNGPSIINTEFEIYTLIHLRRGAVIKKIDIVIKKDGIIERWECDV